MHWKWTYTSASYQQSSTDLHCSTSSSAYQSSSRQAINNTTECTHTLFMNVKQHMPLLKGSGLKHRIKVRYGLNSQPHFKSVRWHQSRVYMIKICTKRGCESVKLRAHNEAAINATIQQHDIRVSIFFNLECYTNHWILMTRPIGRLIVWIELLRSQLNYNLRLQITSHDQSILYRLWISPWVKHKTQYWIRSSSLNLLPQHLSKQSLSKLQKRRMRLRWLVLISWLCVVGRRDWQQGIIANTFGTSWKSTALGATGNFRKKFGDVSTAFTMTSCSAKHDRHSGSYSDMTDFLYMHLSKHNSMHAYT